VGEKGCSSLSYRKEEEEQMNDGLCTLTEANS
jgi:hypothetical protein